MTTRLRWWLWLGTMCSLGALHCGSDDPAAPGASGGGTGGTAAKAGAAGTAGAAAGTGGSNGTAGTGGSNGTAGTGGSNGTAGTGGSNGTAGTGGSNGTAGTGGSNGTAGTGGSNGTAGTGGSNGTAGTGGSNGTAGTGGSNGTAGTGGSNGTAGTGGSNGTAGTGGSNGTAGTGGSDGTAGQGGSAAGAAGGPIGTAGSGGAGGSGSVYPTFPIAGSMIWVEAGRNTQTGAGGLVTKAFDLGYPADKAFGLFSTSGLGPTLDTADPKRPFIDFKAKEGLQLTYGTPGTSVLDSFKGGYSLYFYVRSTTATDYGPLFDCGVDQKKENFDPLVNRIFFGRPLEDDRLKYIVFNPQGGIAAEATAASTKLNENAFHLIGIAQNAEGAITISVDGAAIGTANSAGTLPTNIHRPYCYVGRSLYTNGWQGNQDYDGDLRAVFGFKGVLTPVQLEQLMSYTALRWQ